MAPAQGQDWLKPLQNLAEDIVAPLQELERDTSRPSGPVRPTPPVVPRPSVAPVAPPVPLARPDFAGDAVAGEDTELEAEDAPGEDSVPVTDEPEPVDETPALPEARPAEADENAVEAPAPDDGAMVEDAAETGAESTASAPARTYQSACPALIQGLVEGRTLPPITAGQCGSASPLEITAVLSRGRMVPLSQPVTTNCNMASALPAWLASVDGYAASMLDSELAQINTGPGYVCRNRYSAKDGFLSEHGRANALDVSGFTLADGRVIDVAADWLPARDPEGRLLCLAHDAACASFTTVLGPEANADHEDHLHLDLGCHGASCTAQLCQ